jgi:hypothetical protein
MVPTAPAAPDTPSTPSPADTATAYYTLLTWVSARATKFDIYLDTANPPTTIVVPKYNTTSYVPTLAARTTYYWKIVAFNDGGSATGPVWSFTTPAATTVLFSVGGSIVTSNALWRSLSINDALGPQPNTANLTFDTTQPTAGQLIRIGLGTLDDDHLLFGGELQDVDQTYVGTPNSPVYPAALIDQTFRINQRRPFGSWVTTSATTIARYLVATFATGFTSNHVQDGLPAVSINFDGSQDFMTCMRALATAISDTTNPGKTKVDYAKDVWLYLTYTGEQPNLIDTSHPPLAAPSPIRFGTDLSQIRTRVYGKGHGEALLSDVSVRETILPIANAVMFASSGGKAIASITSDGAQSQILTYAGVQSGGSGSLVGPGTAPSTAPTATLVNGTGIDSGVHSYAYTDVTASGESLPSPLQVVTTGTGLPAPAALSAALADGSGVDSGTHDYAVTFITSVGETTPSTVTTVSTGPLSAPVSAPTAGTPTSGGSVDAGTQDYEVTFVTAAGETTPGPISNQVATSSVSVPAAMSNNVGSGVGSSDLAIGDVVFYVCTFTNAVGETTAGPASNSYTIKNVGGLAEGTFVDYPARAAGATGTRIYRNRNGAYGQASSLTGSGAGTFPDNGLNWNLGAIGAPPGANTAAIKTVPITGIPTGGASVTNRKLYRRFNGSGTFKLVTTLNASDTTYTDTTANASLGAAAPSSNTAARNIVSLTSIATGTTGVTSRKVYRTVAGASQLKLLTTLSDNVTTSFTDSTADASLGANAPTSNTALMNQVSLSGIAAGASPTTSRKVYRTATGASQLKLLTTLADNTTTTFADSTADSALGANAPTGDTSALTQVSGQVLAGATSMQTSSAGPFSASTGGWATAGSQTFRYTGVSGNTLIGIPPSGPGAIVATVNYGSQVVAAPALTGINSFNGVNLALAKGSSVNIWVQRDDTTAQAALGLLERDENGNPSDGIREYVISDERSTEATMIARCDADLAIFSRPVVTATYYTRDSKTKSGRTASISLPGFGGTAILTAVFDPLVFDPAVFLAVDSAPFTVYTTFTIQSVAITVDAVNANPLYHVTASSVAFTLNDLLRRVALTP